MALGLKSHKLDFEILDTGNPKTLVFLDSSEYMSEPERPLLEVTLPGHTKYFLLNIAARKVNTFNSNTIGLSELFESNCLMELPDGIYTFKYKICPYDSVYIQKKILRKVKIDKSINMILRDADLSDERLKKELTDIWVLIAAAEANTEDNQISKAIEQFKLANSMVDKILDRLSNRC